MTNCKQNINLITVTKPAIIFLIYIESQKYQVNDDSFNFETETLSSDHIVTEIQ